MRKRKRLEELCGPEGSWDEVGQWMLNLLLELGITTQTTVYEFGCGSGRCALPIAKAGIPYIGCDIRPEAVKACRRVLRPYIPYATAMLQDGVTLCGRELFAFAFQVVYHVPDDYLWTVLAPMAGAKQILFNVNTTLPEGTWRGFPFLKRPVSFYVDFMKRYGMEYVRQDRMANLGYPLKYRGCENTLLEFRR